MQYSLCSLVSNIWTFSRKIAKFRTKYLCCDCAVVILVEDSESLFEGCQLVGGQGFQDPFPVSLAKGCHSGIITLINPTLSTKGQ